MAVHANGADHAYTQGFSVCAVAIRQCGKFCCKIISVIYFILFFISYLVILWVQVRQAASRPLDLGCPQQHQCPTCISLRSCGRGSIGGDCSTTASPPHVSIPQPSNSSGDRCFFAPGWGPALSSWNLAGSDVAAEPLLCGTHLGLVGYGGAGGPHQPLAFLQEARASNQSTPIASPQRLYGL